MSDPEVFYKKVLLQLAKLKIPFMVGGTFAVRKYTGIKRDTGDMDLFCKPGDYPKILSAFKKNGFKIELLDDQWLAKIHDTNKIHFADIIFGSISGNLPVDETWLKHTKRTSLFGSSVRLIPPEELIWSKAFRQEREKYDGADVNHLLLKKGRTLDWKRLLQRMEQYWEVLFAHLLNFRFVYPSERNVIPKWLMNELVNRLSHQLLLPSPEDKICRGTLLSKKQYNIDIKEWKFQGMSYKFNVT